MPSQIIYSTAGTFTWPAPSNLAAPPRVQLWGATGTAAGGINGSHSGGAAGSGAYGEEPALGGVTAGVTTLTITLPAAGSGTAATVTGGSVTVSAACGLNASGVTGAFGGAAGSNTVAWAGAQGGNGVTGTNKGGGGGASGPGTGAAGVQGGNGSTVAGTGATAPSGGGNGGNGGGPTTAGSNGNQPGGAPGGGGNNGNRAAGTGVPAYAIITWTVTATGGPAVDYAAGAGHATGAKKATGTGKGYAAGTGTASGTKHTSGTAKGYAAGTGIANPPPSSGAIGFAAGTGTASGIAHRKGSAKDYAGSYGTNAGAAFNPGVINAWSNSFAQPSGFGPMPPALQSVNVPLTPAYATIGGSGLPSPGNWLFAIVGWNQSGLTPMTVEIHDDIHSLWRPNSPSVLTGNTRSVTWYTPNLQRQPAVVYVAPNGMSAAMAVLVVEVANLGPWDLVTGTDTTYGAAATSITLALPAP